MFLKENFKKGLSLNSLKTTVMIVNSRRADYGGFQLYISISGDFRIL